MRADVEVVEVPTPASGGAMAGVVGTPISGMDYSWPEDEIVITKLKEEDQNGSSD